MPKSGNKDNKAVAQASLRLNAKLWRQFQADADDRGLGYGQVMDILLASYYGQHDLLYNSVGVARMKAVLEALGYRIREPYVGGVNLPLSENEE